MRNVVLLCLLLALFAAACGDEDNGGNGGGTPPVEPEPEPEPEPAVADGCSANYPRRVAEPDAFSGFVVLCDVEGGTGMSVRNIGNVVLVVSPDRQQWQASDATPAPQRTFASKVIATTIPAACGSESCSVPPGATLTISAADPVRAIVDVAPGQTAAAMLARTLGDQINARFGTPGQRLTDQIVNCAQQAPQALQGAAWEEAFRNTLNASSSCLAVMQQLGGDDAVERQTATQRVIAQARRYSSGAWVDALLIAGRAIR